MRYVAANGITPAVELTEAQALEDYQRAKATPGQVVEGAFGKDFTISLVSVNGAGRPVRFASTAYLPLGDD